MQIACVKSKTEIMYNFLILIVHLDIISMWTTKIYFYLLRFWHGQANTFLWNTKFSLGKFGGVGADIFQFGGRVRISIWEEEE